VIDVERSVAMSSDTTEPQLAEAPTPAGRLEDLYVRNAPGALRLAYFLTGNRELAEDLVQEAFVRVAGRFRHLRMPDAFDAYLRRTIVNLWRPRRLRRGRQRA
jgi:RNA polymerase sigma factor (sigma-70 family)